MVSLVDCDVFSPSKAGDPDLLLQEWLDYVKTFQNFLKVTGEAGDHTAGHMTCGACVKTTAMLRLIGGREVEILLDHTAAVVEGDSLESLLK